MEGAVSRALSEEVVAIWVAGAERSEAPDVEPFTGASAPATLSVPSAPAMPMAARRCRRGAGVARFGALHQPQCRQQTPHECCHLGVAPRILLDVRLLPSPLPVEKVVYRESYERLDRRGILGGSIHNDDSVKPSSN